jgi:predicted ATP-grasp superfamily ATP-dependent carboligase
MPSRSCSIPLLILSWNPSFVLPVLRSLGSRRGGTWVACGESDAFTARSRHVRELAVFEAEAAPEKIVDWLRECCRRQGIALLLPNDGPAVRFVAANRAALNAFVATTLVPSVEAMELATDKGRLTRFLQERGIPCPRTLHAGGDEVRARNFDGLRFPVLAKATNLAGGEGIHRCADQDELIKAIGELEARRLNFLVQELVEGPDVDCSLIAEEGEILAWTTQRGVRKTHFGAAPVELVMEPHPRLVEHVGAVLRELRWSGVAHIDSILDTRDDSYCILEINGRFWGSVLASTAAGINFPQLLVTRAAGLPVPRQEFSTLPFYWADIGWRRLISRDGRRYRLGETQVPFFLRDPWPELKAGLRSRLRRCFPTSS